MDRDTFLVLSYYSQYESLLESALGTRSERSKPCHRPCKEAAWPWLLQQSCPLLQGVSSRVRPPRQYQDVVSDKTKLPYRYCRLCLTEGYMHNPHEISSSYLRGIVENETPVPDPEESVASVWW